MSEPAPSLPLKRDCSLQVPSLVPMALTSLHKPLNSLYQVLAR